MVQAKLPIRRRRRGIVRSAALRRDAFSSLNGIGRQSQPLSIHNTARGPKPRRIAINIAKLPELLPLGVAGCSEGELVSVETSVRRDNT